MVGASLTLLHWLVRPGIGASTTAPWAVGASLVVATVSTYWAYRRGREGRPPDQGG